jgi:hypothetical protein
MEKCFNVKEREEGGGSRRIMGQVNKMDRRAI